MTGDILTPFLGKVDKGRQKRKQKHDEKSTKPEASQPDSQKERENNCIYLV